jgi:hypothetical protein
MKKTSILLSLVTVSVMSFAQTTRLSLYEEFTGENCAPCAATNPGLKTVLDANVSKIIPIKWQVPIPSAPTNTWSIYQTDKPDINWRFGSSGAVGAGPNATAYGYPAQYSSTNTISNGINSAPTGLIDGQHAWTFGATSDHPFYLNSTIINTAQSVTSPFSITMSRAWDPTFSSVTVTVSVTAAQNFTVAGPLVFRLVMVEQEIHFAAAPGSNGEKDFYNAARAAFPTLQNGTSLPLAWTTGQNQTFTVNCTLPSYIIDKSMVNFIGFIQNDNATTSSRMVYQAAKTNTVGITNDAAAVSIAGNYISCGTSYSPQITVKNNGTNVITSMTINPQLDATPGAPVGWTGSLAPGASTLVSMPVLSPSGGTHTYSINISLVNGIADANPANNTKSSSFGFVASYFPAPLSEPFTLTTFPPTNWFMNNPDGGTATWSRIGTVGAYAVAPLGAAKYDFYNNASIGDQDELYLTPSNFTGLTNMKMTFDVAYAQYTNENDKLEVMVSSNCGATWSTLYSKAGTTLMTAPSYSAGVFAPTATQWRSEIINLGAYDNMPNVLVKMVTTSAYGNDMYIDNVNLVSTTGINNMINVYNTIELYPNPAQNETNIHIVNVKTSDFNISVLNALGQIVTQKTVSLESGNHDINIDTKGLANGIYNVVIANHEGTSVKKLIISK